MLQPLLDSWTLTISGPLYVGILITVFIIVVIIFGIVTFRRKIQQVKVFANKVEEQNSEIEAFLSKDNHRTLIEEGYLQFTYNISHEISNPLQSIQINLENMADCSPEETGRQKQYYSIIKQEIKRLFTLTENLRLLSQLESPDRPVKREPVNLKSVTEDVIMTQAERASSKDINLEYQGPNRPAKVLGNRDHLYQLINNLVDNSIKYSKNSGGSIVIRLEERDVARIVVTDEGIGIPEEDQPYIFDTAYRSPNTHSIRRTGSGLGLAIVKRKVDQHEGNIEVRSVIGEGTTITVNLPLYQPAS